MTRTRTIGLAVLALVLAMSAPAGARQQSSPPQPLSLTIEEAIERAIAQAPSIAEAAAREHAAAATAEARRAAGRPSAAVSSGFLRTNHVDEFGVPQSDGSLRILFPDIPSNYRVRGEMTVPLYTGGRVDALVDAAEAERAGASADGRAATADIRLEVTRAYWTLVTARETTVVLERGLGRTDAWVVDVKSRVDAGLLPPNDVLSAQAQRARQSVRLIQARNQASAAAMDLARLIGVDPTQPLVLTSAVDAPDGRGTLASEEAAALITRALAGRPEREALVARRTSLALTADAARAATRPQVGALAAVEPARPNPRFVPRTDEWRTSWDLGVDVRWSVFDGGRARAESAAVLAQADAIDQRLRDFDARVAVDIRQRLLEIESTRAAQDAAAEAIAAATEAHRVVMERFRAGVATSTDVLDAEVALLEAELERTRLAASLRLSEAGLRRAVGNAP
jgi:outer membrane protein TolC